MHTLPSYFLKIYFNLYSHLCLDHPIHLILSGFQTKPCISQMHICQMHCPNHLRWYDNNETPNYAISAHPPQIQTKTKVRTKTPSKFNSLRTLSSSSHITCQIKWIYKRAQMWKFTSFCISACRTWTIPGCAMDNCECNVKASVQTAANIYYWQLQFFNMHITIR